jgi:hypothetical protein
MNASGSRGVSSSCCQRATIGATMPPSLWPTMPTLPASTSACDFRNSVAASASVANSKVVALAASPPDPIVAAQHRDAASGEGVGDHEERLVPEDRLVAVLQSAAGDEHHARDRRLRGRVAGQRERAREGMPVGMAELDVPHDIGKRRLGMLRTRRPVGHLAGHPGQFERKLHAGLPQRA